MSKESLQSFFKVYDYYIYENVHLTVSVSHISLVFDCLINNI